MRVLVAGISLEKLVGKLWEPLPSGEHDPEVPRQGA